jgi:hypothetical protein
VRRRGAGLPNFCGVPTVSCETNRGRRRWLFCVSAVLSRGIWELVPIIQKSFCQNNSKSFTASFIRRRKLKKIAGNRTKKPFYCVSDTILNNYGGKN